MSITPENSSAGWPSFGEHFKTPENSASAGLVLGSTSLHLEPKLQPAPAVGLIAVRVIEN